MRDRGHPWSKSQHEKYSATMARKRHHRQLAANGTKEPEKIYILIEGRLQPFVLRNMPVYVPVEQ